MTHTTVSTPGDAQSAPEPAQNTWWCRITPCKIWQAMGGSTLMLCQPAGIRALLALPWQESLLLGEGFGTGGHHIDSARGHATSLLTLGMHCQPKSCCTFISFFPLLRGITAICQKRFIFALLLLSKAVCSAAPFAFPPPGTSMKHTKNFVKPKQSETTVHLSLT